MLDAVPHHPHTTHTPANAPEMTMGVPPSVDPRVVLIDVMVSVSARL